MWYFEIDLLSKAWEKEISDMYIEIEKKEIDLKTEQILLTKDMYNEKREVLDKSIQIEVLQTIETQPIHSK